MERREAVAVYEEVDRLTRRILKVEAERDLYRAKYHEALAGLAHYDPERANAVDSTDPKNY